MEGVRLPSRWVQPGKRRYSASDKRLSPQEEKLVGGQEHLANKCTCYERKATALADFVVKVLSPLSWCCSTRTCATFDGGAELTVAVQSV